MASGEGRMIGAHYRHTTEEMPARMVAAIAERLAVALAVYAPECTASRGSGEEAAFGKGGKLHGRLTAVFVVVELRGFEPLTPCMPCKCSAS